MNDVVALKRGIKLSKIASLLALQTYQVMNWSIMADLETFKCCYLHKT